MIAPPSVEEPESPPPTQGQVPSRNDMVPSPTKRPINLTLVLSVQPGVGLTLTELNYTAYKIPDGHD